MLVYNYHSPDLIRSPFLKKLLERWDSLRGDHTLPPPKAISRESLGDEFDSMSRLEVHSVHYKPRFKVIEQGKILAKMYGEHCPGHFIDEVLPKELVAAATESYLKAFEKKAPIYTIWEIRDAGGNFTNEERLLLPFGASLLGVTDFWLAVDSPIQAFSPERLGKPLATPKSVAKAAIDPE